MALYLHVVRSPTGRRLLATGRFTEFTEDIRLRRGDVIFSWGSDLIGHYYELHGAKLLNGTLCYDKAEQGRRIIEAGISLPKLYLSLEEWRRDNYPNLIKKPRCGQGGRGVVLCTQEHNRPGWRYDNVYQLYIDKMREFRVQQIGQFSAYIMEKFKPIEGNGVCWNLDQGSEWHACSQTGRLGTALNHIAKATLEAISYNFGAVDVMEDRDNHLYVLECNSRPGLGRENIHLFADTMVRYYESL